MTDSPPFARTKCACKECVACCKRQPGPLAPGDFERIAAFLGEDREAAKQHFWASPGAMVKDSMTGQVRRIGSITPRMRRGRCVFLTDDDRCSIHEVAPFGCAYFDPHQSYVTAHPRSIWLVRQTMADPEHRKLRDELPYATSYKPARY
jgi:Fe-S-cluster containining protein